MALRPARRTRTRRPAALVAALSAGWLLAGCGGSRPPTATPPPPITRPPTTQPVPTPPTTGAPAGRYVWARAASPDLAIGGGATTTIAAVQAPSGGRPWLVAGTRLSAAGSTTATIWRSPGGATWNAEPLTGPSVDSRVEAATVWGHGAVVVGSVGRGSTQTAAVWISRGPDTPFVQESPAGLPLGAINMDTVASGGLGLFATGESPGGVAVWYSSNGSRWTQLAAAQRVINGATDPHINSLTVAANGVFAAGWQRDGNRTDAAVWTSTDGVNWHAVLTAAAAFAGGGDRIITGLVAVGTGPVPTGFVAVGGVRLGSQWQPVSWISPNGASWSEPSHLFAMGRRPQGAGRDPIARAMSIVTDGPESATLVAVGGSSTAQRLWRSADGVHWTELPLPASAANSPAWTGTLVSSDGPDLVVASGVAGEPHVLIDAGKGWTEPSAQPSAFGAVRPGAQPVGIALGPQGLVLAVRVVRPAQGLRSGQGDQASLEFLTSPDGAAWSVQPAGPTFAGATVLGLTAWRGRLLAVGSRNVAGQPRAAAWVSTDGATWTGVLLDQGSRGQPTVPASVASGACARGAVVTAVGAATANGFTAARAWVSADGVHWRSARVATSPRPAASYTMSGCTPAGTGFLAYGSARPAATSGPPTPVTWAGAASGAAWAQQGDSAFDAMPGPLTNVAGSARSWLALAAANPVPPAAAAASTSLYESDDNADSWQLLDTTSDPWAGAGPPQLDQLTWWGPIPVVAGDADGQLAVWTGTATS